LSLGAENILPEFGWGGGMVVMRAVMKGFVMKGYFFLIEVNVNPFKLAIFPISEISIMLAFS
jgi:hypothetical protein